MPQSVAGRGGHVETDDKKLNFDLSAPGGSGPGTNPEQLFACGYSACFGGAVEAGGEEAGRQSRQGHGSMPDVTLNQDDNGFFIGATLNVSIEGIDRRDRAEDPSPTRTRCAPIPKRRAAMSMSRLPSTTRRSPARLKLTLGTFLSS